MARGDDVRRERAWCPKSDGGCGAEFWRDIGSRRRKCVKCSPPRVSSRGSGEVVTLPPVDAPVEGEVVASPGSVAAAALTELDAAGRLDTTEGQLVVLLAREMQGRVHSGSQLAAMSKAILEAKAVALQGAPGKSDAVDELFDRRTRRQRGA